MKVNLLEFSVYFYFERGECMLRQTLLFPPPAASFRACVGSSVELSTLALGLRLLGPALPALSPRRAPDSGIAASSLRSWPS